MIKQSLNSEYEKRRKHLQLKTPVTMTSKSFRHLRHCLYITEHLTVLKKRKNLLSKNGINWMINFIFEYFIRHDWWLLHGMNKSFSEEVTRVRPCRDFLREWSVKFIPWRSHGTARLGLKRPNFFGEWTVEFTPRRIQDFSGCVLTSSEHELHSSSLKKSGHVGRNIGNYGLSSQPYGWPPLFCKKTDNYNSEKEIERKRY